MLSIPVALFHLINVGGTSEISPLSGTQTEFSEHIVIVDTVLHAIPETDTLLTDESFFARISYSHSCLNVLRDNEHVDMRDETGLLPGDVVKTCARHFAILDFHPDGLMILYPSSKIVLDPGGNDIILKGGEIQFENDAKTTSFPSTLHCYDESMYHVEGSAPVSFGVHCRGDSGMILVSKKGSLWWNYQGNPYEITDGNGVMGRITTANYSSITLPDRPIIIDSIVAQPVEAKDTVAEKVYSASFRWTPVPLADQYIVHIYQDDTQHMQTMHHLVTLHHRNEFSTELPESGDYKIRVMAIDFYGVSGDWSPALSFVIGDQGSGASGEAYPVES